MDRAAQKANPSSSQVQQRWQQQRVQYQQVQDEQPMGYQTIDSSPAFSPFITMGGDRTRSTMGFLPQQQDVFLRPESQAGHAGMPHGRQLRRHEAIPTSANTTIDPARFDLDIKLGVEGKPYSYARLITYAIAHSETGKMSLSEIYDFCLEHFPYFSKQASTGWKNSVRHNLSLNKLFVKIPRPVHESGKGAYWALDMEMLAAAGGSAPSTNSSRQGSGPGPLSSLSMMATRSNRHLRTRSHSALEPLQRPHRASTVHDRNDDRKDSPILPRQPNPQIRARPMSDIYGLQERAPGDCLIDILDVIPKELAFGELSTLRAEQNVSFDSGSSDSIVISPAFQDMPSEVELLDILMANGSGEPSRRESIPLVAPVVTSSATIRLSGREQRDDPLPRPVESMGFPQAAMFQDMHAFMQAGELGVDHEGAQGGWNSTSS
ncbi:hypothetical protein PYCC9005_002466 [Savitreella phatthalungensis]